MTRTPNQRLFIWTALGLVVLIALVPFLPSSRPVAQFEVRSSLRSTPDGIAALSHVLRDFDRIPDIRLTPYVDADRLSGPMVLLEPRDSPSPREVHALLEWVRRGGTLIYSPDASPLADSLSLRGIIIGTDLSSDQLEESGPQDRTEEVPSDAETADTLLADTLLADTLLLGWADHALTLTQGLPRPKPTVWTLRIVADSTDADSQDTQRTQQPASPPYTLEPLLSAKRDSLEWTVAGIIPIGAGRIYVFAQAEALSNDRADEDPLAILAIRAMLAHSSPGDTIIFDEFHQGVHRLGSPFEMMKTFFLKSPTGRTAFHLGIVLLLTLGIMGIRLGAPITTRPPNRRSPLEHVNALARIYQNADAKRTAAVLLLSRLARSLNRPAPKTLDGAEHLLRDLEQKSPGAEISRLRNALSPEIDLTEMLLAMDSLLDRHEIDRHGTDPLASLPEAGHGTKPTPRTT